MLNTPWETGSALYRRLLVSALVITGVGILLAVSGAISEWNALVFGAMPVIVAGLACHIAGMVVRARDVRRRSTARR
ncbi:hypothetical protein [Arthrobacter sp. Br18]|uniref:hypothetical protein n=1 Tax=Arthrobacter sp. Br18 TaxID=1312954 RepID=UPI00047D4A4A|nr:hypothetical protein [Arthrobacter sp. Br18]